MGFLLLVCAFGEAGATPVQSAVASRANAPEPPGPSAVEEHKEPLYEMVIEIVVARGPRRTVAALGRDSTVLVPLSGFMRLAELEVSSIRSDTTLVGVLHSPTRDLVLDTRGQTVTLADSTMHLASGDATWSNGELYLESGWLNRLFAVRAEMRWETLELVIFDSEVLPVMRRLDRNARRLVQPTPSHERWPRFHTIDRLADGAAFDWSVSSSTRDPLESTLVRLGMGAQALGGSLDVRYTRNATPQEDIQDLRFSWIRAWPDHRAIRQIRVGELGSTGRLLTLEQGVSISNAPFLRSAEFAEDVLRGDLPSGWEVELYRDGRLVGFQRIDEAGQFGLQLPVRYGQNPLELVAYGPSGEVVRTRRNFEAPFERLPAEQFEYGASVGRCVLDACSSHTNLDARYGISQYLTVQGGVDYFWRDSIPGLFHPYALASYAISRTVSVTGEGVLNGLARLRTVVAPSPDLRVTAVHTLFDTSDPAPIVGRLDTRHLSELTAFWRPMQLRDRVFFEAGATRASGVERSWSRARVSGTVFLDNTRLTVGVVRQASELAAGMTSQGTGVELQASTVLGRGWGPLSTALLRGRTRILRGEDASVWSAGIGRSFNRTFRVDLEAAWQEVTGTRISLNLTTNLPGMRSVSQNHYSKRDGVRGQQFFEGSVLWNRPGRRAEVSSGAALGRAGIVGEVFVDSNGNDIRDPGEQVVPQVAVRVGISTEITDSLGTMTAWDLMPFENTVLEINPLSVPDPLLVPVHPRGVVSAAPNSFTRVQIPMMKVGEVSGTVLLDGRIPLGGMPLVLRSLDTGQEIELFTFSDGSFYAMTVRPGRWEAVVDAHRLALLQARAEPLDFTVAPGGAFVEGLLIEVTR